MPQDLIKGGPSRLRTGILPGVSLETGAAQASQSASRAFLAYSNIFGEQAQREEISEARKEGEAAAAQLKLGGPGGAVSGMPELRDDTKKTGQAFNSAVEAGYQARTRTAIEKKALGLARAYPTDPDTQEAKFREWQHDFKQAMPDKFKPGFDLIVENALSSNVSAAVTKQFQVAAANRQAAIAELMDVDGNFAHQKGLQTTGSISANTSAELISMWQDRQQELAAMVSPFFTPQMAQQSLQLYTSATTKRFLMGMFDGADNKEQFLADVARGDIVIPVIGPDGAEAEVSMMRNLTLKDREDLQSHFKRNYDQLRTLEDTAREDRERILKQDVVDTLAEIQMTGDPSLLADLESNPFRTSAQLREAHQVIGEGVGDPEYFSGAQAMVTAGYVLSVNQLDHTKLSYPQRKQLREMVDAWKDDNHFSKSLRFAEADDLLQLNLIGVTDTIAAATFLTGSDKTQARAAAVGKLQYELARQTDRKMRSGAIVERADDGEKVTIQDQVTGERREVEVFDPVNWVEDVIESIDAESRVLTDEIDALNAEIKAIQGDLGGGDRSREAEYSEKVARRKELRRRLNNDMTGLIERAARKASKNAK